MNKIIEIINDGLVFWLSYIVISISLHALAGLLFDGGTKRFMQIYVIIITVSGALYLIWYKLMYKAKKKRSKARRFKW